MSILGGIVYISLPIINYHKRSKEAVTLINLWLNLLSTDKEEPLKMCLETYRNDLTDSFRGFSDLAKHHNLAVIECLFKHQLILDGAQSDLHTKLIETAY
ncbi:hypothetical protein ACWOAH_06700 [Vagococcus vulneris]|uniref:Uncharacterized protein n=1 Tax=Vagococcus vulneris TaxID=1977869 RepID=A0A429ZY71_9ENTE|nr:hypothetical protein [Vagococcus vulneris]RST98895.1 hypothetical protein CBF37_05860 [Vagococcus vulneris]